MDARRWERIQALFHGAQDLDPDERERFLAEACGDESVREEVAALLVAADGADDYLGGLAARAGALYGSEREEPIASGRTLGAYRLIRCIGEGGMGTVYLAERADGQLEMQVAVKVLPPGLDTGALRRRFLAERQILARLEHPGIARLLDAGLGEDGTPFFVMEYVEGEQITAYCERLSCSIDQRIDLFLQICETVEYAHRNLVVHRDLKPSNILVTPEGKVKLLDFGIAKVLDAEGAEEATALTHQARPMTPAYASPEQVRGEPVTTATDVYALGVLLYELLAGRPPYEVRRLSPTDLERLVCTEDPAPPSSAVDRAPADGDRGADLSADPARRARRLRGDLDTIVLMALRKEPERRYPSVSALADDLLRHRSALPIRARPSRLTYRAGKFVQRRPGMVAAGATAVFLVVAYGAMITAHAERLETERNLARVAAQQAERERDRASSERLRAEGAQSVAEAERNRARAAYGRAEAEAAAALAAERLAEIARRQAEMDRDRAETEAAKAGQVTEFLAGLFEASDPARARGEELTARELLDRGAGQVERLGTEPEVQAELLAVMGRVYRALGLYDQALPLAERALALRREVLGEEHPDVARSLNDLGQTLRFKGDLEAAESHVGEALAMQRRLVDADHLATATYLSSLGLVRYIRGDLDSAEPLLRDALQMRRRLLGNDHPDVATLLNTLGLLRSARADFAAAEALLREALEVWRSSLEADHPLIAQGLSSLAFVRRARGDLEAAETLHREALQMRRRVLGDEHPRVAESLNNLGVLLSARSDPEAAEPILREALDMRRRLLGTEHVSVASSLNSLAFVLRAQGDLEAAESLYREALQMRRRLLGNEHPDVAVSLNNLGFVLRARGDLEAAESLYREALQMRRRLLGDEHPDVAQSLTNLGVVLRARGDDEAAAAYLKAALDLRVRVLGEDHPAVATTRRHLESVLVRIRPTEAAGSAP